MKKKIIGLSLVVALVAMLFAGMTIAYFTDSDKATNVFTIGDINIELTEDVGVTDSDGKDVTDKRVTVNNGNATFTNILPGNVITKAPTVKNIGSNPAYVRTTVIVNNYDLINAMIEAYEDKGYTEAQIETLVDEVFNGWGIVYSHNNGFNTKDMRMTIPVHSDAKVSRVDSAFTTLDNDVHHFSRDNWFKSEAEIEADANDSYSVYDPNGYYTKNMDEYELCYTYYMLLQPGESVTLFNGLKCPIEFDETLAAMFEGLEIEIYADAIQAEGFGGNGLTAFAVLDKEIDR